MRKLSLVAAALAFVGCAKAGIGPGDDDGDADDQSDSDSDSTDFDSTDNTDTTDESPDDDDDAPPIDSPPPIDGPEPDAAPMAITLSQTGTTVGDGFSIACANQIGETRENSWFRVFDLTASGITGPLTVSQISFGVETAIGAQTVDVRLGTYAGAIGGNILDTALITPLTQQTVTVTATTLALQTVPIAATVPAGGKLVVQISAPDYAGVEKAFYLGTTTDPETTAGYLMSATCGISQPQSLRQIQAGVQGATPSSVIITVDGTH